MNPIKNYELPSSIKELYSKVSSETINMEDNEQVYGKSDCQVRFSGGRECGNLGKFGHK
ncbi:MAG: hypothetical protein J6X84_04820 [Treponema sp.]|nr:hypothetical protein [Treponema sp.]